MRRTAWYVVLTLGVAGILTWWGGTPGGVAEVGPWRLVSGRVVADGSTFVASEAAELRSQGVTILLEGGTRVALRAKGGRVDATPVPRVVAGKMVLTTGEKIRIRRTVLEPTRLTQIVVTPWSATVLEGTLTSGGQRFDAGDAIPLRSPPPTLERLDAPEPEPQATVEPEATGRVVDARSHRSLAGVRIVATFSHTDDGYPPTPGDGHRRAIATDADGRFRVPPWNPHDPRLKLHLEATHPEYAPLVHVIEVPADLAGRWQFTTLALRRAWTYSIQFLDPGGAPLGGAAVEVLPRATDAFLGEDSWEEGRTRRTDRPTIRYTDDEGILRCGPDTGPARLLHPFLYVWDEVWSKPSRWVVFSSLRWPPGPDELPRVYTRSERSREYRLEDLGAEPLVDTLVAIELEGMPPVRLYTGARGEFEFAPLPPATVDLPRPGVITTLSPFLWKHRVPVSFPAVLPEIRVEGRLAGRLQFQLEERTRQGELLSVAPEGVAIDRDLTLVERTESGNVTYAGNLPPPGTTFEVSVRGYEPQRVPIPASMPGARHLDLGAVTLERGRSLDVVLTGGDPDAYSRARWILTSPLEPWFRQEFSFDATGRKRIEGLVVRRRYQYAIEGSRLRRVAGEFVAFDPVLAEGITVSLDPSEEVESSLTGEVNLPPDDDYPDYRVVERYFSDGEDGPRSCVSYPLAPDGRFGSRRILPPPREAEIFVHGPGLLTAHRRVTRRGKVFRFDFGELELVPSRTAEFSFVIEGFGKVPPPEGLSLFAREGRYHEVAGITYLDPWTVLLTNLMPGVYALRWEGQDVITDAHLFRVTESRERIREAIPRAPQLVEWVEVRVIDADGNPVEDAEITSRVGEVPPVPTRPAPEERVPVEVDGRWIYTRVHRPAGIPLPPAGQSTPERAAGRAIVPLYTDATNEVGFRAPGFLPATVFLPPGRGFSEPFLMKRGAKVEAHLVRRNGLPFEGVVGISWRDVSPPPDAERGERVRYGAPFAVRVVGGRLWSDAFPPGPYEFIFQHEASDAKKEVKLSLTEGKRHDIGIVELVEGRAIRGIVSLPNGDPAAGGVVALVEPAAAFRFPQMALDLTAQQFSTEVDAQGFFRIDGLPLELDGDLALVAHLDGWTDAVELPVDFSRLEHRLFLDHPAALVSRLGYGDGQEHPDYEFRLHFGGRTGEEWVDLGPLVISGANPDVYLGITPGFYRATWNLKDPHPDVPGRFAETVVAPGKRATLRLAVLDEFIRGIAIFNGERLETGWALLTPEPFNPNVAAAGRVRFGEFEIPRLDPGSPLYGALIPARSPPAAIDPARGEALPLRLANLPAPRHGPFTLRYDAYDVVIAFDPGLLNLHPDLEIRFPHYEWSRDAYRERLATELVTSSQYRLSLLQPVPFTFRVIAPGAWTRIRTIDLTEDTVFPFVK